MSNKMIVLLAVLTLIAGVLLNKTLSDSESVTLQAGVSFPLETQVQSQFREVNQVLPGNGETWHILFLGYTSCPDICPTTLMELAAIYPKLKDIADVNIVFVSVDPQRDSADIARDYTAYFNKTFKSLVIPEPQLQDFAKQLNLSYRIDKESLDTDSYTISHSAALAVLTPDNQLSGLLTPTIENNLASFDEAVLLSDFALLVNR